MLQAFAVTPDTHIHQGRDQDAFEDITDATEAYKGELGDMADAAGINLSDV